MVILLMLFCVMLLGIWLVWLCFVKSDVIMEVVVEWLVCL